MSVILDLAPDPLERLAVDVAVVPLFAGDRPLRGAVARADWRLCGRLSALVGSGRITGSDGEAVLVPSTGGLGAPLLVVLGHGDREALDADRCRSATADAVTRALGLGAGATALALPDAECGLPELSDRLAACLAGIEDALIATPDAVEGEDRLLSVVVSGEEQHAAGQWLRVARSRRVPAGLSLRPPAIGEREAGRSRTRVPAGAPAGREQDTRGLGPPVK